MLPSARLQVCPLGILREDGTIQNEISCQRLAEVALAYAKAGEQSPGSSTHAWLLQTCPLSLRAGPKANPALAPVGVLSLGAAEASTCPPHATPEEVAGTPDPSLWP